MRLHEYEAKELLARYGIRIPRGTVAANAADAEAVAADMAVAVMVKAQVLAGGRGKAGGIRRAGNARCAGQLAAGMLSGTVHGLHPSGVLIEEQLDIHRELYLGITVDTASGCPVIMLSAAGGVDIESVARETPAAIARLPVNPLGAPTARQAAVLARDAGLGDAACREAAPLVLQLYRLFSEEDALIAEINPLAELADGSLVAADAVVEIDAASLFRHPAWDALTRLPGRRERAAQERGMTFVDLGGGEIGLICSGAGLGMATVDLIADQADDSGRPRAANFLETGGGITRELMAEAMRLVLSQPGIRGLLINVYGGINPIHEGAAGIADALADHPEIPVIAKALGNRQEETWTILRNAGVEVVTDMRTEAAVQAVCRRLATPET